MTADNVERVAMAMAYSIRQPNDVSHDEADYWAHTGSAAQHTWMVAARAAIAAMQPTPADDETCTGCYGSGWDGNREATCHCQPTPAECAEVSPEFEARLQKFEPGPFNQPLDLTPWDLSKVTDFSVLGSSPSKEPAMSDAPTKIADLKIHSDAAWDIASQYSYALASDTRTLAAQIDTAVEAAVKAEREAIITLLDTHNQCPCVSAPAWTDEEQISYEAGQIDATVSWQFAIRARGVTT